MRCRKVVVRKVSCLIIKILSPEEVLRLSLTGSFFPSELSPPIIEGNSKYAESEWRTGETGDKWLVASQARRALS